MILFLEQVTIIIPKFFLEECKYVVKEEKIPKYIFDDIEISFDSDRENCDKENSDEKNSDKNGKQMLSKTKKKALKKKNAKSVNIVVRDIEIFLKKKKKRSVNMVVNYIRIFYGISIEKSF